MAISRIAKRGWLIGLVGFLSWAFIFGIIYAQSPLYSTNQNAYYLHGLAKAGFGYLNNDWLANTQESMPVFSGLVYLTYVVFHSSAPSYFYYALLLEVYLFSMYGIMDLLFDLRRSKARTFAFVTLFLAAHSAALRYILSRVAGSDASFLLEGGVAGQRLLGQVFQPSVFGVFLILSIYLFMRKRPFLSLLPLAAAIYFHPVYLLSGALLTLAYMWVFFREERKLKRPLLLGLAALLLVMPSLAYTIYIFWEPSSEIAQKALDILVNFRNPHHALVLAWLNWIFLVQLLILLMGLFVIRKTRLFPILLIVTSGTLILTLAQAVTGSNWLALVFPWRVSVLLVPMGTTILIAFTVTNIMGWWKDREKIERWVKVVGFLTIVGLMAVGAMRVQIESARQRSDPARPMMTYVAEHKSPGDVFLVPIQMQDFRLITGAPIFVDFKSAPDRDRDVLEWYRRILQSRNYYWGSSDPCQALRDLARQEGVTHAVAQSDDRFTVCYFLPIVYQDSSYTIYSLINER